MLKALFVYYHAQNQDGSPAENNMVLRGIKPLRNMEDVAGVQDYIMNLYKYKTVRVVSWQRMEGQEPKA